MQVNLKRIIDFLKCYLVFTFIKSNLYNSIEKIRILLERLICDSAEQICSNFISYFKRTGNILDSFQCHRLNSQINFSQDYPSVYTYPYIPSGTYTYTLSATKNHNIHIHEVSVALHTSGTKHLIHINGIFPKSNMFPAPSSPELFFPVYFH